MPIPNFKKNELIDSVNKELLNGSDIVILRRLKNANGITSIYKAMDIANKTGIDINLYAEYTLIGKNALNIEETTFTLSVDNESHRYDSEGIISKNTAAEVCRNAMINIWENDYLYDHSIQMLIQVHDEIVFQIPTRHTNNNNRIYEEIRQCMSYPFNFEFKVPLDTSGKLGHNWSETK